MAGAGTWWAGARRWRVGSWRGWRWVWRAVSWRGARAGAADQLAGSAARSLGADVFTITPADVQTDVGNFLRATQFEFGKYIRSHTFVAVQSPLDPAALRRPGIQIVHRFGGTRGYRLETGVDTRYLLREPTLSRDQNI